MYLIGHTGLYSQLYPQGKLAKEYLAFPGEKAVATHSSTLAWKIPWTEEPGKLQSMGSRRVGYDWATLLSLFTFLHWRRKWQPTRVLAWRIPGTGEPGGLPSLGSHRVRHDWSDLAAAAAAFPAYIVGGWQGGREWRLEALSSICHDKPQV